MNRLLLLPALLAFGLVSASAAILGEVPVGTPGTLGSLTSNPAFFSYQQSDQNPCVIGDPSCKEGLLVTKTLLDNNANEYNDIFSPYYGVSLVTSIVNSTTFGLGLDLNNTVDEQHLTQVGMFIYDQNGVFQSSQIWIGDASLKALNNGSGFSDVNFFGFDLTGVSGTWQVRFFLDMPLYASGAQAVNDGREGLFLLATEEIIPPNEVPEPSTYALIGGALVGLQLLRRRK